MQGHDLWHRGPRRQIEDCSASEACDHCGSCLAMYTNKKGFSLSFTILLLNSAFFMNRDIKQHLEAEHLEWTLILAFYPSLSMFMLKESHDCT